jgi:hypothetical protein
MLGKSTQLRAAKLEFCGGSHEVGHKLDRSIWVERLSHPHSSDQLQ